MLTLVLWQHVVFVCESYGVRMSLVMVVRRMLCSVRLVGCVAVKIIKVSRFKNVRTIN